MIKNFISRVFGGGAKPARGPPKAALADMPAT